MFRRSTHFLIMHRKAREIERSLRGTVATELCFEVENEAAGRSKLKKQLKGLSRDLVDIVKSSDSIAALRSSLEVSCVQI